MKFIKSFVRILSRNNKKASSYLKLGYVGIPSINDQDVDHYCCTLFLKAIGGPKLMPCSVSNHAIKEIPSRHYICMLHRTTVNK